MLYAMPRSLSVKMPKEKSTSSTKTSPYLTPSTTNPSTRPKSSIPKPSIARSSSPSPLLLIIPGASMATTSVANPSRKPLPMVQIKMDRSLSLSLSRQKLGRMQKGRAISSLPSFRHSCRRSGCSPAEPYPPHECLESITLFGLPFPKGTSLLCRIGDISILH